jgi:hypothetical protein
MDFYRNFLLDPAKRLPHPVAGDAPADGKEVGNQPMHFDAGFLRLPYNRPDVWLCHNE